jgi:hypothetical protein
VSANEIVGAWFTFFCVQEKLAEKPNSFGIHPHVERHFRNSNILEFEWLAA